MHKFAELLDRLYFTYSHIKKRALLCHYFSTTCDPERGYALAVMAGTLEFPTFSYPLLRELIQSKVDSFLFELSYDYIGDISDAIALLWPQSEPTSQLPSLEEIIITFKRLNKKELPSYLAYLLNEANATERWALLKLGTGSLRIGVSARFLKQVLAKWSQIELNQIEHVWHSLTPPYKELFAWLEGKADLPQITGNLFFHPLMLSHPLQEQELNKIVLEEFALEKKYDGIRVQLICNGQEKILFSRSGDNISQAFPELLEAIHTPVVLDGELVIRKGQEIGSFNALQQRLNRKKISKKHLQDFPSAVILYDILSINQHDVRQLSFIERRSQLEQWFREHPSPFLLLSPLLILHENQSLLELKAEILQAQEVAVEGLMLKHKKSPYVAGRPKGHWYKWKRDPFLVDAVLMYAQRGHGKRSSFYSDYTFGLWEGDQLLPIGKAYSGFTDEELRQLDKWVRHHIAQRFGPVVEVEKSLVLEVAFDRVNASTRHKSGVALRFPRIHRIRWDKPAKEADQLAILKALIRLG